MRILAIETSTMVGGVALMADGEIIAEETLNLKITHSRSLLVSIDRILKISGTSVSGLDAIAISIGPGSFTGLRIGLSTVKGLAHAGDLPIIPVYTLDAFAQNLPYTAEPVCPLLDARKGEVYTALFMGDCTGVMKKMTDDLVIPPEKLTNIIEKNLSGHCKKVIFMGNGAKVYGGFLKSQFGNLAIFAPLNMNFPRASNVAKLAWEKAIKGEFSDRENLAPRYVRQSF